MDKEARGKEGFVADARQVIDRGTRELDARSQQGELSIADIRQLRQLIRMGHQLDALEAGTDPPSSPDDDRARDVAEAVIDRVEALGDKADAKQLATLRTALAVLDDIKKRERRSTRRPARDAAAAEPSALARQLLAQNGLDEERELPDD